MAETTANWYEKSDFFLIERRWLAQARKIRAKASKRPPANTRAPRKGWLKEIAIKKLVVFDYPQ